MNATVRLHCAELADEDLQDLAFQLRRTIEDETDIVARPAEGGGGPGVRGEPVTLATIGLAFLTSGTAVALMQVLRTYFRRTPSLEVELTREDGRKLSLKATHVAAEQLDRTQGWIRDFFAEGDTWARSATES